jgi:hypothetical protein
MVPNSERVYIRRYDGKLQLITRGGEVLLEADAEAAKVSIPEGVTLEVAGDEVSGGGGSQSFLAESITFTETAGAGEYSGEVVLPVGAVLFEVTWQTTAGWAADTAALNVGDGGSATAFINGDDVKSVAYMSSSYDSKIDAITENDGAPSPVPYASGDTITAILTTTGAGGTTGRSLVTVFYIVPTSSAAAKS